MHAVKFAANQRKAWFGVVQRMTRREARHDALRVENIQNVHSLSHCSHQRGEMLFLLALNLYLLLAPRNVRIPALHGQELVEAEVFHLGPAVASDGGQ